MKKISLVLFTSLSVLIQTGTGVLAQDIPAGLRNAMEREAREYQDSAERIIRDNAPSRENIENHVVRPAIGAAGGAVTGAIRTPVNPGAGAAAGAIRGGASTCISCHLDRRDPN